jgi:hypothetical protein
MELSDIKRETSGLSDKSHAEKIKIFAWYLHTQKQKAHFQPADIKGCYDALHLIPPQSFGGYFTNLLGTNDLLKNAQGYRLAGTVRDELDKLYTPVGHRVEVAQLLRSLPSQIPDLAERTYLDEALICYEHGAFRAAIVMTWNLAYHHLCNHILKHRLADFNARWLMTFAGHHRNGTRAIATMDEFNAELKESEVLKICRDASIITKDVYRILEEKLGRRNSAAHPSSVSIGQLQTDAFIDDLVRNVVLKIQ